MSYIVLRQFYRIKKLYNFIVSLLISLKNTFYIFKLYKFSTDITVLDVPFKSLKYITTSSFGPLFPKLLGTYEEPTRLWIEKVIKINYSTIINIGFGEGYYA